MTPMIYWDVDTQHDFVRATGKLYVPGSEEILPVLARLTDHAHAHRIPIVASADDHLPGHRELSDAPDWRETFPPHCMRGTPGQAKVPETTLRDPLLIEPDVTDPAALGLRIRAHRGDFLLHKHWFDVFTNPNTRLLLDVLAPESIVLYGVALDVCNRYAIDGLLRERRGARLALVTDAVRAIDPTRGESLLDGWRRQGVRMVTSEEAVAEGFEV